MFVLGMAVGACFGIVLATLLVTAENRISSADQAELERRIEEVSKESLLREEPRIRSRDKA